MSYSSPRLSYLGLVTFWKLLPLNICEYVKVDKFLSGTEQWGSEHRILKHGHELFDASSWRGECLSLPYRPGCSYDCFDQRSMTTGSIGFLRPSMEAHPASTLSARMFALGLWAPPWKPRQAKVTTLQRLCRCPFSSTAEPSRWQPPVQHGAEGSPTWTCPASDHKTRKYKKMGIILSG